MPSSTRNTSAASPSASAAGQQPRPEAAPTPVDNPRPRQADGEGAVARLKELGGVFKALHDGLGRTAVAFLGGELEQAPVPAPIPTGDAALDEAFGGGGVPRQRMIEVSGRPSVGKTSFAYDLLARVQRAGGVAAFVDVEHCFGPARARALGVNTDTLVVAEPATAEEALFIAEELVNKSAADVIVLDSVAALVPEAELDGRVGEAPAGLQARLVGQALRRLTVALRRSSSTVVLINHLRPGMDGGWTSPGGSSLPFFVSVRLTLEGEVNADGALEVRLEVTKSKLGPAHARATLVLAEQAAAVAQPAAELPPLADARGQTPTHKLKRAA